MIKGKIKIAGDLFYTILSTVVMQIALHLIIYPLINRFYGAALTGEILYFIGVIYIFPQAVGTSISNTRLVIRKTTDLSNGDFKGILTVTNILAGAFCFLIGYEGSKEITFSLLFAVFAIVYSLRMYAQVEFRLKLNFKGYFIYYALISVGYVIGFSIFLLTKIWLTIFFTGELFALCYSLKKGSILKNEKALGKRKHIYKTTGMMLISVLIRDGVAQFDKVILQVLINAESVAYYNALSLVGKSIQMLVNPVNTLMLSYLSVKDSRLSLKTFKKFSKWGLILGLLALIGCQIATPIYIKVFYSDFFESVIGMSLLVNSGLIMGFIASLFTSVILSQGKTKSYTMIQAIWGIGYTIPSFIFTNLYGIVGIATVTLIVNTIKFFVAFIISWRIVWQNEKF